MTVCLLMTLRGHTIGAQHDCVSAEEARGAASVEPSMTVCLLRAVHLMLQCDCVSTDASVTLCPLKASVTVCPLCDGKCDCVSTVRRQV
jgi:hypothetical protein